MITWLGLALVLNLVALFAAWSRMPTRVRGVAVASSLIGAPLAGGLLITAHGWPVRPVPYLAEFPAGKVKILGFSFAPEKAIYVMVEDSGSPRLFELPWSNKEASQIQRMMERGNGIVAEKRGGKKGYGGDKDYPVEFHDEPQPDNPQKQPEAQGFEYQRT